MVGGLPLSTPPPPRTFLLGTSQKLQGFPAYSAGTRKRLCRGRELPARGGLARGRPRAGQDGAPRAAPPFAAGSCWPRPRLLRSEALRSKGFARGLRSGVGGKGLHEHEVKIGTGWWSRKY